MDLSDIASVSGKSGLFKIVSPTRTGAIIESLDGSAKKMVVGVQSKVSVLSEISIYTTNEEGSVPLRLVFKKIHEEFNGDTGLDGKTEAEELSSFMEFILPDYDVSKVYASDIRKIVNWYTILSKIDPDIFLKEIDSEDSDVKKSEE